MVQNTLSFSPQPREEFTLFFSAAAAAAAAKGCLAALRRCVCGSQKAQASDACSHGVFCDIQIDFEGLQIKSRFKPMQAAKDLVLFRSFPRIFIDYNCLFLFIKQTVHFLFLFDNPQVRFLESAPSGLPSSDEVKSANRDAAAARALRTYKPLLHPPLASSSAHIYPLFRNLPSTT
jgi:hypothetical protein